MDIELNSYSLKTFIPLSALSWLLRRARVSIGWWFELSNRYCINKVWKNISLISSINGKKIAYSPGENRLSFYQPSYQESFKCLLTCFAKSWIILCSDTYENRRLILIKIIILVACYCCKWKIIYRLTDKCQLLDYL